MFLRADSLICNALALASKPAAAASYITIIALSALLLSLASCNLAMPNKTAILLCSSAKISRMPSASLPLSKHNSYSSASLPLSKHNSYSSASLALSKQESYSFASISSNKRNSYKLG